MKTTSLNGLLLTLCVVGAACALSAQTTLSGSVLSEDDEPLAFANILLLQAADSALIKGVVANDEGRFEVTDVDPGEYLLSAMMVGYELSEDQALTLDGSLQTLALKPVVMHTATTDLDAVEVTARKPLFEQQADRLVVNVQSSITAAGNTALEVLERSPGIIVDRQNYNISMNGKSGVVIMINGKRSRMDLSAVVQMLQGMNAGNIEKIELITAPPARYDADGDAGIIHIVLKEHAGDGLNGSYSAFGGLGARPKVGGSLNVNYRRGAVNLFGNVAYNYDWTRAWFTNARVFDFEGVETHTTTRASRLPTTQFLNGQAGLDVNLSDKTIVGLLFGGYSRNWETTDSSQMQMVQDQIPELGIDMQIRESSLWSHYMGNVNLQHSFTTDKVLNIDLDYLHYYNDNPSDYMIEERDLVAQTTTDQEMNLMKETPISVWVGKVDYRQKVGASTQWEMGLKGTHSQFNNTVALDRLRGGSWIQDPEFTQDFELLERVGAAYTSFQFRLGEKHQLTLGLRYEFTDTQLDSVQGPRVVDREYGSFFPTVFYAYQLADKQALQFSYNRRITRPAFNQLAPFVIFSDPFTFFAGNTNLRASLTDAVKIGYSLNNYLLSVQYSYDKFPIFRFQPEVDPERNRQVFFSQNMDHAHTLTGMLTFPVYIGSWWEMQNSAIASWQRVQASFSESKVRLDQRYLQINTSQTFTLPLDFAIELSGFYRSPVLNGISERVGVTVINLGLQKRFPKLDASLSLNLSDLLNQNTYRWRTDVPDLYLETVSEYKFESRVLRLTYSQSFGNQKVKRARQRQTGSSAEQNRVTQ